MTRLYQKPLHHWLPVILLLPIFIVACEKPEKAIDNLALAQFYIEQNNDEQALGLLVNEISAGENLAEAQRMVGEIFLATGSHEEAIRHFSLAMEQGCAAPCSAGLIDAYLAEGQGELAARTFAASATDRGSDRARYQQIMIDHLAALDYQQTIARLSELDTRQARDRIMLLLLEQQRYPEIAAGYAAETDYSETQLIGFAAAYYALEKHALAQEILLRARHLSPGKLITRNKILAVELLVRVNVALGKITDAERIYQAFLETHGDSGYVAVRNSQAHLNNARFENVIDEVSELARYNPENQQIARLVAAASAGMGKHQAVVNAIGRFADELDEHSTILLANAYIKLGRPRDAIDLLGDKADGLPAKILLAEAHMVFDNRERALAALDGTTIPTANAERKRLADLWFALGQFDAIVDNFAAQPDTSPAVRQIVLRAYLALDRVDAARAWIDGQSDPFFAAELRAMIELNLGNDAAAIAIYQQLLRESPNKRHRIMLAMTQLRRQAYDAALEQLREALEMPGENRVVLNLALRIRQQTGNSAVVEWLDSIEPNHPDYRSIQLLLANHDTIEGNYQSAQQRLLPYANDQDPFIYRLRARALSESDPEAAWRLMERSLAAGFSLDTAARLARHYLQQRDRVNLARIVEQIEKLAGINIGTSKLLATSYLFLENYPRALQLADHLERQGYSAGGRELRADTLSRQGQPQRAALIYRELYEDSQSEALLVKSFTASITADEASRALVLAEAETILAQQPEWNALRYFVAMQNVDRDNRLAIRHFNQLVDKFPDDAILLNNVAWANLDEDPAAALKYAGMALELHPDNDDFLDTYARALRNSGDIPGARQLLAGRLEVQPDNPLLRELLQSMQ